MRVNTGRSTRTGLDALSDRLKCECVGPTMDQLFDYLLQHRNNYPTSWPEFREYCANHQLRKHLLQDPFTFRASMKPRGYAGDAVMMDYIYGVGETEQASDRATLFGRQIFEYMRERTGFGAVRFRRRLIAKLIDSIARERPAQVLAIASGHLREAEISNAVLDRKITQFVAYDQDEASLNLVSREYGDLGVTRIHGSLRQILAGKVDLGTFDFVYAAGLFDYLCNSMARALIARMFEMVRPGGKLLVPNFLPSTREIGYMEAFMDWRLIYRDRSSMDSLAASLPEHEIARCECWNDPSNTIVFLLISKHE